MFKKLLFLILLAGIGFGIYTGIHKIVEVATAPKTVVVSTGVSTTKNTITSGSDVLGTVVTSGTTITTTNSGTVTTTGQTTSGAVQEPGFFTRIWNTITGWFCSTTSTTETTKTTTKTVISTGTTLSGETISGDALTGYMSTGFFEEITSGEKEIVTTGKVIIDSGSTETVTNTKTTTQISPVKKPTTTKTTKTTTKTTSGKDPILNALFN